jgi:hypothetical protein
MRWDVLLLATIIIVFGILYEWPKIKKSPKKDKVAFCTLLIIGWGLAMFDLPNIAGLPTLIESIFKPIGTMLETYKPQ